jgi:NitT/TauT family transport system substrate-binding protein
MKNYVIFGAVVLMLASIVFYLPEKPSEQKSIYVVSMTADEMMVALSNGSISGFISWEPYPSLAVSRGYAKYLVNSSEAWENHPSLVLAISEDMNDEDMIRALVWSQVKSTRFINEHSNIEKVLDYGQEFLGLDRGTVMAAINNTVYSEYPDLNETKRAIEIISKAGVINKNISFIGYNNVDDFISNVFINKYYNEVKNKLDEDPNWIPPRVNGTLRFGYITGSSLNLAMYIAEKEGYYEESGLVTGRNIQFIGYRSGRALTDAFKLREIDAGTLGATVLLRYKINDNGRIRIIAGVNSGGTSLVVRSDSDIMTIEDLNGKKIATPGFGTCQDTIMRKMFDGFKIKTQ